MRRDVICDVTHQDVRVVDHEPVQLGELGRLLPADLLLGAEPQQYQECRHREGGVHVERRLEAESGQELAGDEGSNLRARRPRRDTYNIHTYNA